MCPIYPDPGLYIDRGCMGESGTKIIKRRRRIRKSARRGGKVKASQERLRGHRREPARPTTRSCERRKQGRKATASRRRSGSRRPMRTTLITSEQTRKPFAAIAGELLIVEVVVARPGNMEAAFAKLLTQARRPSSLGGRACGS